jgi:small-conductance mechanosensitive channel
LRSLLIGLGVFFLFYFLSRSIRQLLRDDILPRTGIDPSLNQVISTFSGYALVMAGLLLALSLMGIPLSTLTVIAGGLSVGIGFGLQELINNFVSGFILLTERSLTPGDVIEIDDQIGVVGEINLRTIEIRTIDNVQLIVPNGQLLQSTVTSYTRNDKRVRMRVAAATSMEANPHQAIEALLAAAGQQANLLPEPIPEALFTGIGERALEFELWVWVADPLLIPYVNSELLLRVWDAFQERGIELPPPEN